MTTLWFLDGFYGIKRCFRHVRKGCMVWFDVDIQIHLGTGIGWITTKGCRAAEVFQGEPGWATAWRDQFDAPIFSGLGGHGPDISKPIVWILFHASAAGSSTCPAHDASLEGLLAELRMCVFDFNLHVLCCGEIRENNFWVVNSMVLDGFADLLLCCFYSMFSLLS